MKTRIFLIAALLIVSLCNASNKETETTKAREIEGSMNVWTTPDLYSLTMIWTAEFTRVNPKATINVLKSDNANVAGMLKTPDGVGFITDATYAGLDRQSIWTMLSGHDIIVPVMNKKNLFLEQIYRNGITTSCLTSMFNGSEKPEWGTLLGTGVKVPLHFYIMNDASIKAGVASFLNNSNFMVDGTNVGSSSEMIAAIRKDINAIGFCRLTDILEPNGKSLAENLAFVPIDKNGNGRLDYMENIYNSPESFAHGVWIGKYPKELSGNLYMVAKVKPANPVETAFLEWVLSDGQQYLATNGFISLGNGEMLQQLAKVQTGTINIAVEPDNSFAILKTIILILFAILITGLFIDFIAVRATKKRTILASMTHDGGIAFDESSVNTPGGLYYDKSHTWAFMEQDGAVRIGIDDFMRHVTGPLTRIDMKRVGDKVRKGEIMFTLVQKGKQLNIHAPVSGTILALNQDLVDNSAALHSKKCSDAWVYAIEPTNWLIEIQFLTMSEKYKIWLKDEFRRLKDFFAMAMAAKDPDFAHVPLQDGGTIKDHVLADLGPEVWEDFQSKFMDCPK